MSTGGDLPGPSITLYSDVIKTSNVTEMEVNKSGKYICAAEGMPSAMMLKNAGPGCVRIVISPLANTTRGCRQDSQEISWRSADR